MLKRFSQAIQGVIRLSMLILSLSETEIVGDLRLFTLASGDEGLLNGEVAAEIIINYLLAE